MSQGDQPRAANEGKQGGAPAAAAAAPKKQKAKPGPAAAAPNTDVPMGGEARTTAADPAMSMLAGPLSNPQRYIEVLHRKNRNMLKKKQKIDAMLSKKEDDLNSDQKTLLASKDSILASASEYEEMANQFKTIALEDDKLLTKRIEEERKDAQAQGVEEGKKSADTVILALVRFLRHASWSRQSPSGNQDEDNAVETVLSMVYEGRESSVAVVQKLASGADEAVDGSDVTYVRIKHLVDEQAAALDDPNAQLEPKSNGDSGPVYDDAAADADANETYNGSQSPVARRGINFLVESEIEGTAHAQPREESPAQADGLSVAAGSTVPSHAPAQTLTQSLNPPPSYAAASQTSVTAPSAAWAPNAGQVRTANGGMADSANAAGSGWGDSPDAGGLGGDWNDTQLSSGPPISGYNAAITAAPATAQTPDGWSTQKSQKERGRGRGRGRDQNGSRGGRGGGQGFRGENRRRGGPRSEPQRT